MRAHETQGCGTDVDAFKVQGSDLSTSSRTLPEASDGTGVCPSEKAAASSACCRMLFIDPRAKLCSVVRGIETKKQESTRMRWHRLLLSSERMSSVLRCAESTRVHELLIQCSGVAVCREHTCSLAGSTM